MYHLRCMEFWWLAWLTRGRSPDSSGHVVMADARVWLRKALEPTFKRRVELGNMLNVWFHGHLGTSWLYILGQRGLWATPIAPHPFCPSTLCHLAYLGKSGFQLILKPQVILYLQKIHTLYEPNVYLTGCCENCIHFLPPFLQGKNCLNKTYLDTQVKWHT